MISNHKAIEMFTDLIRGGHIKWNDENKKTLAKLYENNYNEHQLKHIPLYQRAKCN